MHGYVIIELHPLQTILPLYSVLLSYAQKIITFNIAIYDFRKYTKVCTFTLFSLWRYKCKSLVLNYGVPTVKCTVQ